MSESPATVLPMFARRESLLSLLGDGPRSKSELVRSLDVSRSTVDRCIRNLESKELVERVDGGFQLSLAGRFLLDEYVQYREAASGVMAAQELLAVLPADADIEAAALRGATVSLSDRTAPYRPAEEYLEAVHDADRVDHITTALSPKYVESFREAIADHGVEVRLGASQSVARRLVSEYDETLAQLFEAGGLTMRELDSHPGYSLGIVDCGDTVTAHYLVYAADGIRGRIETATPSAVAVARERFDHFWDAGTDIGGAER